MRALPAGATMDATDFESSVSNDLMCFSFEDRKPKVMKQNLDEFGQSADSKKPCCNTIRASLKSRMP